MLGTRNTILPAAQQGGGFYAHLGDQEIKAQQSTMTCTLIGPRAWTSKPSWMDSEARVLPMELHCLSEWCAAQAGIVRGSHLSKNTHRDNKESPLGGQAVTLSKQQLEVEVTVLTHTHNAWSLLSFDVCRPLLYPQRQVPWLLQWKNTSSNYRGNGD